MSWVQPVANGLRTDHPVPGLPFINDERLDLTNPDAIERIGRQQEEGLWGRTDSLPGGGWVALTTETKNRGYAWAVHQHPEYGRTVLLVRDEDMSSLHYEWMYGRNGFLYRHGGYWWDGSAWHRPQQVIDRAYEGYDARLVEAAMTITAADLLAGPGDPSNAQEVKIASFTAPDGPLPNWRDHLALWAEVRQPGALPLDRCIVDLRAPELESDRLVDRAGLAKAAALALEDLPHPEYGRNRLPVPQAETANGSRWSQPVALDWAEQHRREHGPQELLSGTTTFGTTQPRGLVADHAALTEIIRNGLEEESERKQKRALGRGRTNTEDAAAQLAWWPAVALSDSTESFIPVSAVRATLLQAIVGGFAEDTERASNKTDVSLGDLSKDVVQLLDWYILREPNLASALFGEICLHARLRLDLKPSDVGDVLRRSLHLDSQLDGKTVNALLSLALPPSALKGAEL